MGAPHLHARPVDHVPRRKRLRGDRTWHGRRDRANAALHERRHNRRQRYRRDVNGGLTNRKPCRNPRIHAERALRPTRRTRAVHGDRDAFSRQRIRARNHPAGTHEALRRSRIPASRRKPILLLGCAMVGRPRLHRGHRRRTRHHRTRAEMGPCHLRNHEIRDARRPSRRRTCAAGSVGNTGCARKQEILGNHHPATRPQSRCHDRLVVWRIPFRARRVGSAGNVRCGLRGCTSDRLDAVRHALHRALPRPRPGRVRT